MNGHDALVAMVLIMSLVIVVALVKSRQVRARIQSKGLGQFELQTDAGIRVPPKNNSGPSRKHVRVPRGTPSWGSRNWRGTLVLSFILILVGTPSGWWFSQPEFWRMLVCDQVSEALSLLPQGSHTPLEINTGKETLDQLARVMKVRIAKLEKNAHHYEEIWIVDHYWRYWLSDSFNDYLSLNNEFVLKGGRIHRMFVFNQEDLDDRELETMLRKQCSIARNSATDVVSSDFELWLAHPDIKSSESYKELAEQFAHLHGTAAELEKFDVLQFNDAVYFSNSFNGSQETLGRSTWIFDPAQIGQIHLDGLFRAKNPVARRFKCDRFQESFKAATGHDSASLSGNI